jgi:hypothetical protein
LITSTGSLSINSAIAYLCFRPAGSRSAGTEITMSANHVRAPLLTIHDVEHPHAVGRRIKSGLTLFGVAAAGVLALIVASPAAIADTVETPRSTCPV